MFQQRSTNNQSPFGGVVGIIIALVAFYMLFKLASFVFSIIWSAAPIIFIASLFIDHKVFTEYVNTIYDLFKRNWIYGVVAGVLSITLFPLVSLFLLGKALFKRKIKKAQEEMDIRQNGELIEYEELDSEIIEEDLPPANFPPEPMRRPERGNNYDELFK